jgi:hypothetical protein
MKKRQRKWEQALEQRALKMLSVTAIGMATIQIFLIYTQILDWNRQENFTEGGLCFGYVTNNMKDCLT